ncbi:MAG: hypothetical protein R3C99_09030 [Pirellulaceae bacterium]|nr:hypothetical protein [Planctomycetales bacterium]MCA9203505.1 hypothetical protein [Planctomycetales bacterium]MCA9221269.1 hypothetical protein [Planctomycetales bacterium]MCA9227671.1 hypothetical protein [Planctomycetales bacterium]
MLGRWDIWLRMEAAAEWRHSFGSATEATDSHPSMERARGIDNKAKDS